MSAVEDILNESLSFLGGQPVVDDDAVTYGPIKLTIAPKEGKANTLLADQLFSPALFLAERIERGLLFAQGQTVLELGAGSGLPSLLLSILDPTPRLVVVTDYPDDIILGNLKNNVVLNEVHLKDGCRIECCGYRWGTDVRHLLDFLSPEVGGYDLLILSDLLHFHTSHDDLVASIQLLSRRTPHSRIHVAAGRYTRPEVCDEFLEKGGKIGLMFEEIPIDRGDIMWKGKMGVGNLTEEELSLRKSACRYWIGRWRNL